MLCQHCCFASCWDPSGHAGREQCSAPGETSGPSRQLRPFSRLHFSGLLLSITGSVEKCSKAGCIAHFICQRKKKKKKHTSPTSKPNKEKYSMSAGQALVRPPQGPAHPQAGAQLPAPEGVGRGTGDSMAASLTRLVHLLLWWLWLVFQISLKWSEPCLLMIS